MVVEPPGGAVLELAGNSFFARIASGETLGQGGQAGVLGVIQAVEYGFGKQTLSVQLIQEGCERRDYYCVGDSVSTAVWTIELKKPGVGVTQCAYVELHDPSGLGVEPCDMEKDSGGQFFSSPLLRTPS